MRKLPVFLLIDVSESVAGPLQAAISSGIETIVRSLRSDPQALETVHFSIIVFAGKARVLVPMTELTYVTYPPSLPIGGGTSVGAGFTALMHEIDSNVNHGSSSRKADWKPLVFFMTDGRPTDDPSQVLRRWKSDYASHVRLIPVAVGSGADMAMLRQLNDEVLFLNNTSEDSLKRFFEWMSQSVAVQSHAIDAGVTPGGVDLSKNLPAGAVSLAKDSDLKAASSPHDDRYVVLVGRCQSTEAPYLLRYEQAPGAATGSRYEYRQAIPLTNAYFDLSENAGRSVTSVSTAQLDGLPPCPQCGARVGIVACPCGGLHCIQGAGTAICPWCAEQTDYQMAPAGTEISFTRGRG